VGLKEKASLRTYIKTEKYLRKSGFQVRRFQRIGGTTWVY
jgi:hypothetical protein